MRIVEYDNHNIDYDNNNSTDNNNNYKIFLPSLGVYIFLEYPFQYSSQK